MTETLLPASNAQTVALSNIPRLSMPEFRKTLLDFIERGARISALLACPENDRLRLLAVLADPSRESWAVTSTETDGEYPSLTPDCPQVRWFEREIAEQWGIVPLGHPWLKPVRFQPPRGKWPSPFLREGRLPSIGEFDAFRMEGDEVHEVAVGPVHAGVIEPGHFRFQCHGETVHHLEISLGYQHRGIERALTGGPAPRTLHYMETLAGDTTISHAMAYCRALESLGGASVPTRALALRSIAAELERIANHLGDLGALAGDVGFLPTQNYCGRIRGDALNLTALLCGNRFGRGLVIPGGVAWDVEPGRAGRFLERLDSVEKDATSAVELMFDAPSVLARFEGTGIVPEETARSIGLVGVAARACGLSCDIRHEMPYGMYCFASLPVCTWTGGDCFARAYVRWLEIRRSFAFIREQMRALPGGSLVIPLKTPAPDSLCASFVEGWRGEICHVALTDGSGHLALYKVVDPSFHNWFGLACALRNQEISDFPLCNKSFNLSYCGHDL